MYRWDSPPYLIRKQLKLRPSDSVVLERFPITLNRKVLYLSFIGRIFLRKVGVHLSGKCSNLATRAILICERTCLRSRLSRPFAWRRCHVSTVLVASHSLGPRPESCPLTPSEVRCGLLYRPSQLLSDWPHACRSVP